ncbi:MAG TPA: phage tail protein [Archangium sp.]|nr:phage tail protein [Archangium sp.]
MPQFTVNSHRLDPYKNFKFRVMWENRYVAGLSKMSALKKTTESIPWREAGGPSIVRKLPGRTTYEPITLEIGLTHDTVFEDWANQVNNPQGDAAMSLRDYRKELIIEVLNMQGQKALAFKLHRAWVSSFTALPDLDANANAVAIQSITIEHEGFERDATVPEPTET